MLLRVRFFNVDRGLVGGGNGDPIFFFPNLPALEQQLCGRWALLRELARFPFVESLVGPRALRSPVIKPS